MVMDLESESSALESVEENEVSTVSSEKLVNADETKVESNGTCVVDTNDNRNEIVESFLDSPPVVIGKSSPSPSLSPSSGTATKGYGLKKWRRIKRDVTKEGESNADSTNSLKRGLPNSGANSNRAMQSSGMKQNNEGSFSSTNAMVRSPGDLFAVVGESGIGPVLGTGTDSENSEDQSSKSSTAASAPQMRYEITVGTGFARDNNRIRNLSGKNLATSAQRGQPGKVRTETSKKLRGELVKIEKENSHSSMESDSQSSTFVFMQVINSATSNGRHSRARNYEEENSYDAQGSVRQPSEELQVGSSSKNGGEFEDNFQEDLVADSSWGIKEEKSENNGPSSDQESMAESISTLQSAQDALEKEIQKFREIGNEDSTHEVQNGSPEHLQFGDLGKQSFDSSESEVVSLEQTMNLLESKLDDATALLKVKEAKILELQESILCSRSPKVEPGSAVELHEENYRDLETELDGLFKQKIEAEVEYLAISRAVQKLRVAVVDQITILEEQKTEQARMLNRLGDAEVKAAMLKGEAEKLENEDIVSADEAIKLKTRICKYTSCFLVQLMLLLIILTLFIWQLSPNYSEVVPT